VNYIPKVLVATVVVVVGLLAATFVRGVVATSADRVGLTYAEYLAGGCYWVLSILTFIAAFNQLPFWQSGRKSGPFCSVEFFDHGVRSSPSRH